MSLISFLLCSSTSAGGGAGVERGRAGGRDGEKTGNILRTVQQCLTLRNSAWPGSGKDGMARGHSSSCQPAAATTVTARCARSWHAAVRVPVCLSCSAKFCCSPSPSCLPALLLCADVRVLCLLPLP